MRLNLPARVPQTAVSRTSRWLAACLMGPALSAQTAFTFDTLEPTPTPHYAWVSNANWSNGMPDSTTDALIGPSPTNFPTIDLGGNSVRAATLTIDTSTGLTTIKGGAIQLTPNGIFDPALRIGVASPHPDELPRTSVKLENVALASQGFAAIGVIPDGVTTGGLVADLELHSSTWLHTGRIDVGSNANGTLSLQAGSLLSGGPGATPSVFVGNGFGAALVVDYSSAATVNELSVSNMFDGGSRIAGALSAETVRIGDSHFGHLAAHYGAAGANQSPERMLFLGATAVGTNYHGEFDLNRNATFTSLTVGDGASGVLSLQDRNRTVDVTVGTAGPLAAFFKPLTLGEQTGSHGSLAMSASNPSGESEKNLIVNGGGVIGKYGTGVLELSGTSTARFTGDLIVGDAAFDGQGTGRVTVGNGSRLVAQNVFVGTSTNEQIGSVSLYPTGVGALHLGDGGVVEITGRDPGFGGLPGTLVIGSGGILSGNGTIDFSNPAGGSVVNLGEITPGNSPGLLTIHGDLAFRLASTPPDSGGKLTIEIGGAAPGTEFDVLHVSGNVDLTGAVLDLSLLPGFEPGAPIDYSFLQVDGILTGTFASVIDHTGLGLSLDDLVYSSQGVSFRSPTASETVPEGGAIAPFLVCALLGLIGQRHRHIQR